MDKLEQIASLRRRLSDPALNLAAIERQLGFYQSGLSGFLKGRNNLSKAKRECLDEYLKSINK